MNLFVTYLVCASFSATILADECLFPSLSGDDLERARTSVHRLHSLLGKTYQTTFNVRNAMRTIYFRLCGTPSSSCAKYPNETVVIDEPGSNNCTVIGRYNDTYMNVKSIGSTWITFTFTGDNKTIGTDVTLPQKTTVTFVCDPTQMDALTVTSAPAGLTQSEFYYSLIFSSKSVCDVDDALSGGSVFCIIFFTVAGVYFLFGFLYQRLVVKAKGVEQIPNYDKWKEFGNLVADGCDFVCRCGTRQEAKMYQGIDDPLGNEESETDERDDRLLPM